MKLHAITLTFIPQNNICYGCPIFKTTCQLPVWGLSKIGRLPANFLYQGNKTQTRFVFIIFLYSLYGGSHKNVIRKVSMVKCSFHVIFNNVAHHGYSQDNGGRKHFPCDGGGCILSMITP